MSVEFKTWDEMSDLEQASATWWDMYKDAYGFRPRGVDTSDWTLDLFRKEMDYLQEIIERNHAQRLIEEDAASHDFEMRVADLLRSGAKDREMALRWIHEAEGSNGDDEYLCFLVGLPYGYFKA